MGDSPYLYPVALRWDEGPEALKQVKNKLLLHFQKRKLSNGGECEIRDLDCSRGHLLIYFREEGVRDRVLQKASQELQLPGNKTLKLDVTSVEALSGGRLQDVAPAKPGRSETIPNPDVSQQEAGGRAEQLLSNVVLIENVQDSCSSEMLTLLIENSRDRNDDTEFYLETIPEIHSAAITFTSDIDILSFIQKFCANHKVIQQKLRAKPLEETRSIRAEGLPPRTEEDLVILYFENPKIGGGQVEEAVMIPEEEAALVTFYDAHVVKVIVEREHLLGKKAISVYRYYPTLGTILYGRKTPQVAKPLPIQIQISPYLLEFIWKDTRLKQSIEEDLSKKMCQIIWPDLKCSEPVITLCFPNSLSSHLRTMAKVGHTWTETVSAAYSLIISKYKVIECKMHPSAWEDIKVQISTAAYEGVLVKPTADAEKVFLAGAMRDVNKIEQTFKKLVEENSKKAERRSKETTKTEPMSAALYHVICSSGLEKKILAEAPELKMEYDPSAHHVQLTGLRDEVLEAKCEILSIIQHLKSKSIQLNPHVLQFLKFADNDEISCLLLIRHNINAVIEMEENSIKLIGHTKKDLTDAEEQIVQELICQQIQIEDKSVLRSPEWESLRSHLLRSHCSEMCTVIIVEFPPGAENHVVVAGLASSVHKSYKEIHEFVEKNTPVQKNIPVKSVAVMQFMMEERHLMEDLKRINVRVVTKHRHIHLAGAKSYVEEAASHVQATLSSIFHDTLHIDKPGAKKHYLSNEKMYVSLVRSNYKCIIHLQKDEEDDEIPNETTGAAAQYQVQLPHGVTISVYRGDLCSHHADVIVNAANEELKHIGGLALALLNAAGRQLQDESDRIVRQQGRLVPGESVITAAGNLPCKQVIHTVGPRWLPNSSRRCENLLRTAITSTLELAAEHGHRSIAIPAVSSGVFGFPIPASAQNIVVAIKDYMEGKGRSSSVTNINLVDTKDETIAAFTKSLKEQFGDQNSPRNLEKEVVAPSIRDQGAAASQSIRNGTLVVQVKEGLLQDATTGVIVNSVGRDLRLDSGGASKALYEKAGQQLQVSLRNEASRAADDHCFVTPGYNLSCDIVIHVVVPSWDGGKGSSEQIFRQTIQTCLNTAEERQLSSITFPAIGTGNLGFPKHLVAAFMFDEVFKFSSSSRNRSLQKVTFVLHPNDKETIKEFSKEQNARKMNPVPSNQVSMPASEAKQTPPPRSDTAFYGAANTLNLGVYEMRVGSITYQVKTGDITKEDTDVIVNSTDQHFNLRSGVSKSILEAAGPSVQAECAQLASVNKKSSHITTQSGNLLCKQILHVVGRNSAEGIREFVAESLQECGNLQASSVAFPAIGTGLGKMSSAAVADIILEAVTEFAKSKAAPCLQMVKVVVFQQQMLDDFYNSMKKKEGTDLPKSTSLLSRITNSVVNYFTSKPGAEKNLKGFLLRENIEPAIFHLCAGTKKDVTDASTWLRDLILKEQYENLITDDWILEFDEQDHRSLSQDQRRLQVLLSFESPGSTVKISGLTRDVLEMTNKIQLTIKKVREKKTKEREAELCSNLVEWRYHNGANLVPFDRMTNLELEKAKSTNTQSLKIDVSGVTYTVLLERNCMRDPRGKELKIERVSKHGQFELPDNWVPMSNPDDVMMVKLTPGNQEYNDVEAQFKKSCQMRIINIERIQNKNLWINYQIKRQAIDAKNGTTTNEKQLFHGTDSNTIKTVNHNGFNRSYAGRNAACYGNGTYFAVEANYSAHDSYSKPDPNGLKYVYLARVLTGVYCAGQRGLVAPPAKNPTNPTDLYDSVTDNQARPTMFVIFHDIQAYPEYLITFTR